MKISASILFCICSVLSFCFSSSALEIIIDNSDSSCTVIGSWDVVSSTTSNCYGPDKYTHAPGSGSETVTWSTSLPAGWYRVDFRINSNTTYATDARYSIIHRDGTANLTINQQRSSSGWYILGGAYFFDGSATVVLSDLFTSGNVVVADAIRFWSVFSFVHMSDSHIGHGEGNTDTTNVANELKTLGTVSMGTYGFNAPPPSFAIHTGDFTEYGQEYWNTLMSIFSGMPFPMYYIEGNHDSTWSSCKERLRTLHSSVPYSFDYYDRGTRHHFAALNSPVLQSPRAAFARDELDWLANDLASLESNTNTYVFFHHPINGASDPKPFDNYRLLETLRPYKVLLAMYGHGHSFSTTTFDQLRIVQGGSTYSETVDGGYNIVAVTHGRIYIAKKVYNQSTTTNLLNRTIPAAVSYPVITVSAPAADSIQTDPMLTVTASISGTSADVTAVDFEVDDDDTWRAMSGSAYGPYTATINFSSYVHGRHWVRVRFTMSSGGPFYKTVPFWFWDYFPKARWIVDLGAASLSCPALDDGKVYVGTNGGTFRCVNAENGAEIWKIDLPADVVSSPAVADGRVVFGCGDSTIYCLDAATGGTHWTAPSSGPVYSSPTIDGAAVYIGTIGTGSTGSRYLYSLKLSDGSENWKYSAGNAIESKPFVLDDTVFFGAWDTYFYALYTANGSLRWRYQRNTSRYYSPGDSWPVASASANRVFVADRQYYLNAINIATGTAAWTRTSVSSQALTPDGTRLLQRVTSGNLELTTFDNGAVWNAPCSLDSAPVSPMCHGSRAVITDQDGLASVVSLDTGAIQYQFKLTDSYQLHPVNIDTYGNIFATTYEGFLLCVSDHDISSVSYWKFF